MLVSFLQHLPVLFLRQLFASELTPGRRRRKYTNDAWDIPIPVGQLGYTRQVVSDNNQWEIEVAINRTWFRSSEKASELNVRPSTEITGKAVDLGHVSRLNNGTPGLTEHTRCE
jgi:hypothetical protein